LVTSFKIWSLLVTFSAYYLNTPLDNTNLLIDKSFDSHQEYTIATSYLAPARGTKKDSIDAVFFCVFLTEEAGDR